MSKICNKCHSALEQDKCPRCTTPPPPVTSKTPPPPPQGVRKTATPPPPELPRSAAALPKQEGIIMPPTETIAPVKSQAKASLASRLLAFVIDIVIAAGPGLALWQTGILAERLSGIGAVLWAGTYWLLRDLASGSPGKKLAGLTLVRSGDGGKSGLGRSLVRNGLPLLLIVLTRNPLLSTLALIVEPVLIVINPRGKRIGDILAGTQVSDKT